jgi:hypothetical protein
MANLTLLESYLTCCQNETTNAPSGNIQNSKEMLLSSVEWWASVLTLWATGAALVAAAVAFIALGFSNKATKIKDEAFQRYKLESGTRIAEADAKAADANKVAAETRERAAKLEKEAAQARLEVETIKLSRFETLNTDEFRKQLHGKPKARVELLFQKDDVDSYMFARAIKSCLDAEGWPTSTRPIREEDLKDSQIDKEAPTSVRAGVNLGGIAYVAKKHAPSDDNDPVNVLLRALTSARTFPGTTVTSGAFGGTYDPAFPDDLIRIIVGPRFHEW